jgi:uncharacterized protein (TIGR03067 family)
MPHGTGDAMISPKKGRAAALFLLAVAGAAAGAPAPLPRRGRAGPERFQGTWKQVSVWSQGNDATQGHESYKIHWVIKADRITIFMKGKRNSGNWTYRADPSRQPAALDLTVAGPSGETYPCIYKLEGDRLTVLIQSFPKLGRPRDFQAWSGTGVGKHVFERVKSGEVE